MTTKHTPTPWTIGTKGVYLGSPSDKPSIYIEGDNSWIALLSGISDYDQGNAAHIVHCVNSHDILVEALRRIARGEMSGHGDVGPDLDQAYHAERIALAALEAAKEEA